MSKGMPLGNCPECGLRKPLHRSGICQGCMIFAVAVAKAERAATATPAIEEQGRFCCLWCPRHILDSPLSLCETCRRWYQERARGMPSEPGMPEQQQRGLPRKGGGR